MIIRKARLKDLDAIAGLSFDLEINDSQKLQPDGYFLPAKNVEKTIRNFLKNKIFSKNYSLIVAEEEDEIIGYLLAGTFLRPFFKEEKIGFIWHIYVAPEYRGRRIVKEMLEAIYGWLRKNKVRHVELSVHVNNEIARRVYRREGFKTIRLRKYKKI